MSGRYSLNGSWRFWSSRSKTPWPLTKLMKARYHLPREKKKNIWLLMGQVYHSSQPAHKVSIIIVLTVSWFITWSGIFISASGDSTFPTPQADTHRDRPRLLSLLDPTFHLSEILLTPSFKTGFDYWPETLALACITVSNSLQTHLLASTFDLLPSILNSR